MRKAVTKDNVFKLEPYRSILNLLIEYQEPNGGLEAKHFRYALIKDHDKDNLHKWTYAGMQSFFGDRLLNLFNKGLVKKDCITSRNALNNFLTTLCNLKVISRTKRGKKVKYKISKVYSLLGERIFNKQAFDWYNNLKVIEDEIGMPVKHYIYGLNDEIYNSLSKEDRVKINQHLGRITDNLFDIDQIIKKGCVTFIRQYRVQLDKLKYLFKQDFPEHSKLHKFIDEVSIYSNKIFQNTPNYINL
jgi:hypothetical protein